VKGGTRLEVGLMLSLTVLGVGSRGELAAQFHDNEPKRQRATGSVTMHFAS
jgi:hypothetical protein